MRTVDSIVNIMKNSLNALIILLIVLFICMGLGGCASVQLSSSYNYGQTSYTPEQINQMIWDHTGVNFTHTGLDTDVYTPVPYADMYKVSKLWVDLVLPFLPEYKLDVFDCSQFTQTFAYHLATKYGPQVGVFGLTMTVRRGDPYGHVLNLIITDIGPVWFEPQTGEWGRLKDLNVHEFRGLFNDASYYQ